MLLKILLFSSCDSGYTYSSTSRLLSLQCPSWQRYTMIELDAVCHQFEPYPYRRMHAGGAFVV